MNARRFYRDWIDSDLTRFEVKIKDTDCLFLAEKNLFGEAYKLVQAIRTDIEGFIRSRPDFMTALEPIKLSAEEYSQAEPVIKSMIDASRKTGVGPMAAVAGAVAEHACRGLLSYTGEIIAENGGDIFIKTGKDRNLMLYAGDSPLSGKVGIRIKAWETPLGVATSSGRVGHSLSLGHANAVCVVSKDAALSDAAATAVCNKVTCAGDIEKALQFSKSIEGVLGCVVIYEDKLGSSGKIELI